MSLLAQVATNAIRDAFPYIVNPPTQLVPFTSVSSMNGFHVLDFPFGSPDLTCNIRLLAHDFHLRPDTTAHFRGKGQIRPGSTVTYNDVEFEIFHVVERDGFGFLFCLDELNGKRFVKLMRLARGVKDGATEEEEAFTRLTPGIVYDRNTNKIVGAMSFKDAQREFYACQALSVFWERRFESKCPVPLAIGIIELKTIPFYDASGKLIEIPCEKAFTHTALQHIPLEWRQLGSIIFGVSSDENYRLSDWKYDPQTDDFAEGMQQFVTLIGRLVNVAHQDLGGTFSNDYASALTSTNVCQNGTVEDLETFFSGIKWPSSEDDTFNLSEGAPVSECNQLLDLTLLVELVLEYANKNPTQTIESVTPTYLNLLYQEYTERSAVPQNFKKLVCALCNRSTGQNKTAVTANIGEKLYRDAHWRKDD